MLPTYQPRPTYTLEKLKEEYQQVDLHPKQMEIVTDEEVCIFLNEHYWLWKLAPLIVLALIILFLSWMGTP
jgi:hypothetical protein